MIRALTSNLPSDGLFPNTLTLPNTPKFQQLGRQEMMNEFVCPCRQSGSRWAEEQLTTDASAWKLRSRPASQVFGVGANTLTSRCTRVAVS